MLLLLHPQRAVVPRLLLQAVLLPCLLALCYEVLQLQLDLLIRQLLQAGAEVGVIWVVQEAQALDVAVK
jgi:hypothetical protein